MKTNNLTFDILRGAWLVNPATVPEYEKLVNNFFQGKYKGAEVNRTEFFAAAENGSLYPGQPQAEEKIIARVSMRGILPAYGDYCMLGADDYLQLFRSLNNNDKISAVILDINGPGSSVDAINMMKEFAEEKKKPFVALANMCYSGHMWTAAILCDHIMAYGNISADFGSIGVLTTVVDGRKAMEKDGYKVMIVRAPQSTTKAQTMVDYYEGNDEAFIAQLQKEMKPMADAFIADMKKYRPNIDEKAEGIFTGSTYNANDALKFGLIDSIGNEKKAYERAQMLVELDLYSNL